MDFLASIQQLHFLRPAWLLLLLPAAFLLWSVYRRSDSTRKWRKVISPHLLQHLTLSESNESGRWRPVYMLGMAWLAGTLALAGPTWQMQASPFSEDRSAMFIVVKVTPEMLAQDIQPSRLQRSVIKIQDLLELRNGIRTGLIAFAGSAHLVMPLTSDAGVINNFAAALEPGIMPLQGDETAEAVELASQRLVGAAVPGSIVLITDNVDASQLNELQSVHQEWGVDVHILAMAAGPEVIPPPGSPAAPALDMNALRKAARIMGGTVTAVTADKNDVMALAARIDRSISNAPSQEGQQRKDSGYYLLVPLILLMLSFFRRGGSVAIE